MDEMNVALAVGGHPDDIEFMMAGTLLLLKRAGLEIHMWSVTDGSLGSAAGDRPGTVARRLEEAAASARIAGAEVQQPICKDMSLIYSEELLTRATSVIRKVKPGIILLPAPDDYHPDHRNASELAASAAFVSPLASYESDPARPAARGQVALYHALPFGLRDPLRRKARAGQYVDIDEVIEQKKMMLRCHKSQAEWLDKSQGIDMVACMLTMSAETGRDSGRSHYAEGWRRRLHLGFNPHDDDPLTEILGSLCWTDPAYEAEVT